MTSPVSCDTRPGCLGPINPRAFSTYHFACLQSPAAPQRQSWAGRSHDYHSDADGRVLRGRPLLPGFVFATLASTKIICQCNQRYSHPCVSANSRQCLNVVRALSSRKLTDNGMARRAIFGVPLVHQNYLLQWIAIRVDVNSVRQSSIAATNNVQPGDICEMIATPRRCSTLL